MNDDPTLPLEVDKTPGSAPTATPISPAAKTWGPFTLLARVGHGGFGEVYRAWDPNLEREVALKLLLPTPAADQQTDREYDAMLREARALASVRHTNIVPIYGIDRHDGRVGFWTDFVRGKTLATVLREQGPFGCREAALIGLDLAKALSAVHRAGILHRDIKAENVMREEGGRILLMDFGLSSLPENTSNIAGTPNYMAPELFTGSPATICSDLYALGILLFALVTGEPPARLSGLSTDHAFAAITHRKTLMDLRTDLPESFIRTVNTAIELNPAKRFSSAGQLAQALAESLGVSSPTEGQTQTLAPSHTRTGLLRLGVMIPVILLVLLVLAVSFGLVPKNIFRSTLSTKATPAVSISTNDVYQHAEALLLRSYKSANVAAAIRGFQQVIQQDPSFALAHASLGRAYLIQYSDSNEPKLLDLARTETNQALSLDPNLAPAYITLARMAATRGDTALALQNAEKAVSLDPSNADAFGTLARVYDSQHRSKEATDALQQAIDLAPDDWRFHLSLGSLLDDSGRAEDAAIQFQKGIDLAPDNAIAYYDLAVVNIELDHLEAANANLQASEKLEPSAYTSTELSYLLLLQGKYSEAAAMAHTAIAQAPLNYEAWGTLSSAYLWSPDHHAEGLQAVNKTIEIAEAERLKRPKDAYLLCKLSTYYADLHKTERSLVLVRQALALAPTDLSVAYFAGYTYEILGDRATAMPLVAASIAAGLNRTDLEHNPRLAGLRNDPAFNAVLDKARSQLAAAKQLDTAKKNN